MSEESNNQYFLKRWLFTLMEQLKYGNSIGLDNTRLLAENLDKHIKALDECRKQRDHNLDLVICEWYTGPNDFDEELKIQSLDYDNKLEEILYPKGGNK